MTALKLHPSELAYALSFSKTDQLVGWAQTAFLPADADRQAWYADGEKRMAETGHLVESDKGHTFSGPVTQAVLALIAPTLVLLAERREGDGLRRMTVHVSGETFLAMTHNSDGFFDLSFLADVTAATAACSAFVGAARSPVRAGPRIDTDMDTIKQIGGQARAGQTDDATSGLIDLGAGPSEAASVVQALSAPIASGMLTVLYCADNEAKTAEPFSVMTNAEEETWILFAPGNPNGPAVVEQSSIPALAARLSVGIAARMQVAAG